MKYVNIILLFCIINNVNAKDHYINIIGMKFIDKIIKIHVNDIIIWTNKTNQLHNVVFEHQDLDSPFLKNGDSFTIRFISTGVYNYYCLPHKNMGMIGKVIVE